MKDLQDLKDLTIHDVQSDYWLVLVSLGAIIVTNRDTMTNIMTENKTPKPQTPIPKPYTFQGLRGRSTKSSR